MFHPINLQWATGFVTPRHCLPVDPLQQRSRSLAQGIRTFLRGFTGSTNGSATDNKRRKQLYDVWEYPDSQRSQSLTYDRSVGYSKPYLFISWSACHPQCVQKTIAFKTPCTSATSQLLTYNHYTAPLMIPHNWWIVHFVHTPLQANLSPY